MAYIHEYIWDFKYNGTNGIDGSAQSWTVPYTGKYKLETWGAQGGFSYLDNNNNYRGGYGGYSVGGYNLAAGQIIYIVVGGRGSSCSCHNNKNCCGENGGYNGGGRVYQYTGSGTYYGSGGGATHIGLDNKKLSDFSTSTVNKVLIVSGGGGGASNWNATSHTYNWVGGSGGGVKGGVGYYVIRTDRINSCSGGSQTGAGTGDYSTDAIFGRGGSSHTIYGPGGGGGLYGGGTSEVASCGGSGYIKNLSSMAGITKHMSGYDMKTTSTASDDYTMSVTCVSDTATADCAKSGHGYARITFIEP